MPDPAGSYLAATETARLRADLAAEKARSRRLLNALCLAVGHLVGHPGTDALLADLLTPDSTTAPAGCTPAGADTTIPEGTST